MAHAFPVCGASSSDEPVGNGHVSITIENDNLKLDDIAFSKAPLGVTHNEPKRLFTDKEDLEDECKYIRRVLLNFQAGMKSGQLDPAVMNMLSEFNNDIAFIASEFSGPRTSANPQKAPGPRNNTDSAGVGALPRAPNIIGAQNTNFAGGNLSFSQPRRDGMVTSSPHCNVGNSYNKGEAPMGNNLGTNESMNLLVNALSNLDTRPVPTPRIFDPESGQSFQSFLESFENYCKRSFRGDDDLRHTSWGCELGKFLQGNLHEAYLALHIVGEPYEVLRHKMLDWVGSSKDRMVAEAKLKFSEAKRKPDEQMRLYAARLSKYYQVAYPNRVLSGKFKPLIEKYTKTVTGRMRDRILNTEAALGDGELTWEKVLSIASKYDARDYSAVANAYEVTNECMNVEEVAGGWHGPNVAGRGRRGAAPVLSGANVYPVGQGNRYGDGLQRAPTNSPARQCFRCQGIGHFARDCTMRAPRLQCYVCGSTSHRAADCERRFGYNPGNAGRASSPITASQNLNRGSPLNF